MISDGIFWTVPVFTSVLEAAGIYGLHIPTSKGIAREIVQVSMAIIKEADWHWGRIQSIISGFVVIVSSLIGCRVTTSEKKAT